MADDAPPPTGSDEPKKEGIEGARWSAVGFEFAAAVGLFFLLGSWADARWGTAPWMRVAGALIGVVLGTYLLIVQAVRSSAPKDTPDPPTPRDRSPRA
jgi:F0F1-type ATP synthase assembly protein I